MPPFTGGKRINDQQGYGAPSTVWPFARKTEIQNYKLFDLVVERENVGNAALALCRAFREDSVYSGFRHVCCSGTCKAHDLRPGQVTENGDGRRAAHSTDDALCDRSDIASSIV